jgi:HPr kinase/phosphorylase
LSVAAAVPVGDLVGADARHLQLALRAGSAGLEAAITFPRVQKAALAVTGHVDAVDPGRAQVLGSSEVRYLAGVSSRRRRTVARKLLARRPPCLIVTSGLQPPPELMTEAEAAGIAVLATPLLSSVCIDVLQRYLDRRLAPRTSVHGDLIDVYGLGVLLLGKSGIGKSECALDLVTRGHRLVSDDMVEIRRENDVLVGTGPELTKYQMEIRGLGLLNIRDLFGISAIRHMKFIELVVQLELWEKGREYDRLGLDQAWHSILGVDLPLVRLPVVPGRNLAILIEVASRNQLLKLRGFHGASSFVERLTREMEGAAVEEDRPTLEPGARGELG